MTSRLNRQVRGACTAFVLISTSILYTESAYSGVGVDGVVYTSVGIDNRGSTDVYVAAIYRVRGRDVWHTKAWWQVKPGLLNGVKIESGTTSERFYLAFLMKNDRGELVYLKNLKIGRHEKSQVERIDKKFCVRREGELTARNSSFSDLSNCPSGYELAPFTFKLSPSTYRGSPYPSDLVLFVFPDKSSVVASSSEKSPASTPVGQYVFDNHRYIAQGPDSALLKLDRPEEGLEVCNARSTTPIHIAIAFWAEKSELENPNQWVSFGWFELQKGECKFVARTMPGRYIYYYYSMGSWNSAQLKKSKYRKFCAPSTQYIPILSVVENADKGCDAPNEYFAFTEVDTKNDGKWLLTIY